MCWKKNPVSWLESCAHAWLICPENIWASFSIVLGFKHCLTSDSLETRWVMFLCIRYYIVSFMDCHDKVTCSIYAVWRWLSRFHSNHCLHTCNVLICTQVTFQTTKQPYSYSSSLSETIKVRLQLINHSNLYLNIILITYIQTINFIE